MNIGVNLRIITYRIYLEQNMKPALEENCYSGNADFFCPGKRRFRNVFESYRFMPFQTQFEGKNVVFPFSQSQGTDKNPVYCFKQSSLPFILLTNQQPFQAKCV